MVFAYSEATERHSMNPLYISLELLRFPFQHNLPKSFSSSLSLSRDNLS
jgi:hypothetical protein